MIRSLSPTERATELIEWSRELRARSLAVRQHAGEVLDRITATDNASAGVAREVG
jgi:hypothetical protein